MKVKLILMIAVIFLGWVCAFAEASDYDFYGNTKYPGAELRSDVELYSVNQSGKGDPLVYERREVDWWPRKGVDDIAVKEGMPLRTWTWLAGPFEPVKVEAGVKPEEEVMETLEAKQNTGDRFFRRIAGYLYPPTTGEYTFVFAADDQGALLLSTDDKLENKKRIAWNPIYAKPKRWDMFASQKSDAIRLEGGKRYYIEVIHEEQMHSDHMSVGWKGPGMATIEIIDGEFLSGLDGKRGRIIAERTTTPKAGLRREWTVPKQFDAHLIGFRGMGNIMTSKFGGDGGPREPGVVLRLADGRKRFFPFGTFGKADQKYILELYVKEMDRIKAGLDKTERVKRPSGDVKFPNNAKPGEPGTMQVESEHFVWLSGSQAGSKEDPWINELEPDKAKWYRDGSIECAEYFWALNEYAGHLMPYWDNKKQIKYEITVPGTKRDGYKVIPGYAGGGYGACGIKGAGGGPWAGALFHEWGHGSMGPRLGGGEALSDTYQTFPDPSTMKGNHHISRPWRNVFNGNGGYGFTVFYNVVGEDPNWGYGFFACLPYGVEEWSVLQAMARVGEQRGMFKNGIRGLGDTVGEYGARLATFDCELEDVYSRNYFAPTRNWLETVDTDKRIYRIPLEEAPEPFGINISRLVADENAEEIEVDFAGLHDPELYSDWRACIIAVTADGTRRYSPMWNKGKMTFPLERGDISHWLTVAATPTALYTGKKQRRGGVNKGKLYSGRHSFRYPWSVHLTGARPGTPRESRGDVDDADLIYKIADSAPAPHDTRSGRRLLAKLERLQKELDAAQSRPGMKEWQIHAMQNLRVKVQKEVDRMKNGGRHPNGGGWVQSTATVAPTAYVGPNAMVLDTARVLDNAIIDDFGIVSGNAVVSDHARVCGQGVVKEKGKVGGYARVWQTVGGEAVATIMPKRPGAKDVHAFGLWANYAMDRADSGILEDWYRYSFNADAGYSADLTPVLNGYLYGKPEFVVEGEHRGFRFDGTKQYGELCPRAVDLGEMTVDITLKPEGTGGQTIFDFGSSTDNCLVLKIASDGKPELVATVGGKEVLKLTSTKALDAGEWASVRVEIDGKKSSLWVDGEKTGETATSFRACDVFPGGQVKRNFLAAARDGTGRFTGVMDQVVIYHDVHEDYAGLPEPTLDSPVRPTESYIASLTKKYGNLKALNAKADALSRELLAPYVEMEKRSKARQQEIMERCPEYVAAVANLAAADKEVEDRKGEMNEKFGEAAENITMQEKVNKARTKSEALRKTIRTLERQVFEADEKLVALEAQRKEAEDRRRTIEQTLRKEFDNRAERVKKRADIAELRKQADEQRAEDKKREEELKKKANELDGQLRREFDRMRNRDVEYTVAQSKREERETAVREYEETLRTELMVTEPVYREQKEAEQARSMHERALREKREMYVSKAVAELVRKAGEAKGGVVEAEKIAWKEYGPEMWLYSFNNQGYRGYYNTAYNHYISGHAKDVVGGGELREDTKFLQALARAVSGEDDGWRTSVDWDWRMKQEIEGRINDLPLMKKWLARTRGPVMKDKLKKP